MSGDDDAPDRDGEPVYRVGAKAVGADVFELAHGASGRLVEVVECLTSVPPLSVRVLESGTVRAEFVASEAMSVAGLLGVVAGTLGDGEPNAIPDPACVPGDGVDWSAMHPTWYAVRQGVDYGPGLVEAIDARSVLRDVLCACLPRGPLAVMYTVTVDGRGVVRVDLTPADVQRLVVLLEYISDLMRRGPECRS